MPSWLREARYLRFTVPQPPPTPLGIAEKWPVTLSSGGDPGVLLAAPHQMSLYLQVGVEVQPPGAHYCLAEMTIPFSSLPSLTPSWWRGWVFCDRLMKVGVLGPPWPLLAVVGVGLWAFLFSWRRVVSV